ncbi:1-acyl-sn-glycerol-3-phosphate acyltransferase [Serratia symbiotica]|nr:1-acyl-sn-glycerol-3-phosphate acyltransferase [Serratia symbiotica]
MLLILRLIITIFYCFLVCFFGILYCLFSPFNPKNAVIFSHLFGRLSMLFGLKIKTRIPTELKNNKNYIYISNHQNNYDMITVANIMPPYTITVGKKDILWIPFFGILYWISGNILIHRKNYTKIRKIISFLIKKCKNEHISIWIFPEGTRNCGRGLMPFKTGAFYIAISAGIPIVPICASTTTGKIHLNRWNNGKAIIEMMPPIDTKQYNKKNARELAKYCHKIMKEKIIQLDIEVNKFN